MDPTLLLLLPIVVIFFSNLDIDLWAFSPFLLTPSIMEIMASILFQRRGILLALRATVAVRPWAIWLQRKGMEVNKCVLHRLNFKYS